MSKGRDIINKVIGYINDVRAEYPEITDSMLLGDGAIYYMNGNDSTAFDWEANNRCCEFYLFYKSTEMGFIKVFVNSDDTIDGYLYLDEGRADAVELPCKVLFEEDALYLASLLNIVADGEGLYDEPISKFDFDRELASYEMLTSSYDEEDEYEDEYEEDDEYEEEYDEEYDEECEED